jgi:hypothetical protein
MERQVGQLVFQSMFVPRSAVLVHPSAAVVVVVILATSFVFLRL